MNTIEEDLQLLYKSLWGTKTQPFAAASSQPFEHPAYNQALNQLRQLLACGSSGLLHGENGVGKSYLTGKLLESLPEKAWQIHYLPHSTLSGSDLLRALCRQAGLSPRMRRSDNIASLEEHWKKLGSRKALIVLEEAQNLAATSLEEVRLLACGQRDTQAPFSLLMIGDATLLARLKMAVNRPLLARMSYSIVLKALDHAQAGAYLQARWESVGVRANPMEEAAQELIINAGEGIPRQINHLAQRAMEAAAREKSAAITSLHVQAALNQMPWIAGPH
jgi:type II secretory pathway predicted ATPase ExeA